MRLNIVTFLAVLIIFAVYNDAKQQMDKGNKILWGVPGEPDFNIFVRNLICPFRYRYIHGKCRRIYFT